MKGHCLRRHFVDEAAMVGFSDAGIRAARLGRGWSDSPGFMYANKLMFAPIIWWGVSEATAGTCSSVHMTLLREDSLSPGSARVAASITWHNYIKIIIRGSK